MARYPFGNTAGDWVFATRASDQAMVPTAATLTFWTDQTGGTQITDLLDAAGNPTTTITVGSDGNIPAFSGPDSVTQLWASASNGPRKLLVALQAAADAVATASSSASAAATSASNAAASASTAQAAAATATAPTDNMVAGLVPSTSGSATSAALAAAYAALGNSNKFAKTQHFDWISGSGAGVGAFTSRVTDANGNPIAGQVPAKPAGEASEGIIDWYHDDSTGYLIHLVAGANMTGAGLIGLGIDHDGGVGLVISGKAGGISVSHQQTATATAASLGYHGSNLGAGTFMLLEQGASGTPGSLLVLRGWSGAPSASRVLSIQNTLGQEFGWWQNDGTFHLTNNANPHEVTWAMGAGVNQKMYVYSGSPNLFFSNYVQANSNSLLFKQGTAASAKGAETMATLIQMSNGNALGFFGATPVVKAANPGTATGTDAAVINAIVTVLKNLGFTA